MSTQLNLDQQLIAWKEFIGRHNLLPYVDPLVRVSWQRCWARLNPYQKASLNPLSPDHLLAAQVASFDLISVARPIMEDIFQFIENSDTALALVNSAGYVLDIIGAPGVLEWVGSYGIQIGALFSEAQVGTNAFALALTDRVPAKVIGPEHYLQQFHELAEAAAPIFDLTGHAMGALGLLTPVGSYHMHTLGLAVAGARAIEGQRQSDILLAEQNSHLAEMNAILSSISEGIVVWNAERVVMHINAAALKIIGVQAQAIVGRRVGDLITYPAFIKYALDNLEPLTDVDATVRFGDRQINCIMSLRFVQNKKALQWIILTFRQEKDVRQLVQRQVGAHAHLTLDDIPGESHEMRRVRRMITTAAAAQASVLIRGESGTGKNVLASAIHNESLRREGPFLIFACSTVPSELVVRELLGYDEAVSSKRPGGRPSKFELANGGSLFFQDVDALPLEAQSILLNFLELGIVQRQGSDHPVPVDVRIIAATAAPMEKLIAQGGFRADLYYRLSAFEISIPPLRDRQKDLPVLVERTLKRLARQLGRPLTMAPAAMELLRKYPWPGNVRELEAVLGRAAVQAGVSEVIGPMHLPEAIHYSLPVSRERQAVAQSLNQIEREAIIQTAEICNGNVTKMAQVLGLGRTTVWRKLKEFNISADDFRTR